METEAQRHHIAIDVNAPELVLIRNALLDCLKTSEALPPEEFAARWTASRDEAEQLLRRLAGIVRASGL